MEIPYEITMEIPMEITMDITMEITISTPKQHHHVGRVIWPEVNLSRGRAMRVIKRAEVLRVIFGKHFFRDFGISWDVNWEYDI